MSIGPRSQFLLDTVKANGGRIEFDALAKIMYPNPKSWYKAPHGGPPGCFRPLKVMINRLEKKRLIMFYHSHGGSPERVCLYPPVPLPLD